MVLFANSIVVLNYDPATDIAVVQCPDLHDYMLAETKYSIDMLIKTIRNYDVRKPLLDSTRTTISVGSKQSREIATYLALGVMKTRVVKVARIQSPSCSVENHAEGNIKHIQERHRLSFQLKNFTSKEAAISKTKIKLHSPANF